MLNALSYDITNQYWSIPPIKGLLNQTGSYTRENDKKIAQDLTMTWAELALLARYVPEEGTFSTEAVKNNFRSRKQRTTAARRR